MMRHAENAWMGHQMLEFVTSCLLHCIDIIIVQPSELLLTSLEKTKAKNLSQIQVFSSVHRDMGLFY